MLCGGCGCPAAPSVAALLHAVCVRHPCSCSGCLFGVLCWGKSPAAVCANLLGPPLTVLHPAHMGRILQFEPASCRLMLPVKGSIYHIAGAHTYPLCASALFCSFPALVKGMISPLLHAPCLSLAVCSSPHTPMYCMCAAKWQSLCICGFDPQRRRVLQRCVGCHGLVYGACCVTLTRQRFRLRCLGALLHG